MRKHWQLLLAVVLAVVAVGAIAFHVYEDDLRDYGYRLQTVGPLAIHHVADGDTITIVSRIGKKFSVRLLGINTKELEHKNRNIKAECYGKEAAEYVARLVDGKVAYLEFDPKKGVSEDYDRLLGYIYLYPGYWSYFFGWNAIDLNLELIEKGFAEEWLYQGAHSRAHEFLAAERRARTENVGGWKSCPDFKKHPRASEKRGRKKHVSQED